MSGALEEALTFLCKGDPMVGVLHRPAQPRHQGMIVVVGGPQTRFGSHRQFLLLARDLADTGYPVLRFDYRGMGDSGGDYTGFEGVADDIRAAVDTLLDKVPELESVVLFGLCDAAWAEAVYAASDSRIGGLVLVNPWVRSEETLVRTQVRHYYPRKLVSARFWVDLMGGKVAIGKSVTEYMAKLRQLRGNQSGGSSGVSVMTAGGPYARSGLAERLSQALTEFEGNVLILLSEADMTAREFDSAVLRDKQLGAWSHSPQVLVRRLAGADHTYSTAQWRGTLHMWIKGWLEEMSSPSGV